MQNLLANNCKKVKKNMLPCRDQDSNLGYFGHNEGY